MQDLTERLDAELASAPAPTFDVAGTLAAGRRGVRRRRLAVGAVGVAAALVVGGTATLVLGGGDPSSGRDGNVAGAPTPSATATSDGAAGTAVAPLHLRSDGTVEVPEGADVVERARFTATTGAEAEIFHVALDGEEYYAYAATADGSIGWVDLPAQGLTLREWAEQQLTLGEDGGAVDRAWVRLDDRSALTAGTGVRIVEQQPDPGLGDGFAPAGEPTAVAEVVRDGLTYFLAVRLLPDGSTEAIPYRRDDRVPTLAAFVSYSRHQYATTDEGGSEGPR